MGSTPSFKVYNQQVLSGIGVWLNPVTRTVRDGKVAGFAHGVPAGRSCCPDIFDNFEVSSGQHNHLNKFKTMGVKVDVKWLGNDFHMEAGNVEGGKIRIDGNLTIGGLEGGMSPMQLLLAGAGGCSAIDLISILKKMKQPLEDLLVEVDGDRQKLDAGYSEYKTIHLHFTLKGELDEKKVQRAVDLSMTKYCSVTKALEKGSKITYDFTIIS